VIHEADNNQLSCGLFMKMICRKTNIAPLWSTVHANRIL